jgi:hypothetical protein
MLRVTIEIVPGGDNSQAKVIEQMLVANISGLADMSDYDFAYTDRKGVFYGTTKRHRRSNGAWTLVDRVLNSTFYTGPVTDTQQALGEWLEQMSEPYAPTTEEVRTQFVGDEPTACNDGTHRATCECGAEDPDDVRDRKRERAEDVA